MNPRYPAVAEGAGHGGEYWRVPEVIFNSPLRGRAHRAKSTARHWSGLLLNDLIAWVAPSQAGQLIGPHDLIVAATAKHRRWDVATFNASKFRHVQDLEIVVP